MAHTSTTFKLCLRSLVLNYRPHLCVKTKMQNTKRGHFLFSSYTSRNEADSSFTSRELVPGSVVSTTDVLLQNLKSASSVSKVLEVVERHHREMNSKHTLEALKCIFELQKCGCSEISKTDIINGLVFPTLCKKLKFQAREYHLNDTVEALKIVAYMGVPTSSLTVQILLQLIRKQVNDLSLQSVVFLHFLLDNMSSCPLVDALKIALPMVCEAQLRTKLDPTDVRQAIDLLQYASQRNLSEASVTHIVHTLDRNFHSETADVKNAKTVVWSICRLKSVDTDYSRLLHSAFKVLSKNVSALSYKEIDYTLHKLTSKVKKKDHAYYHEDFVNSCGRYVVMQDCGFEKAAHILQHLSKLDHVCIDLLEYIAQHLVKNPKLVEECRTSTLMMFVRGLAAAGYKPDNWNSIKEALLDCSALQEEERLDLPWIKFALDLAYLDCFSDALLERIFNEDFLDKILAREYNLLDLLQLLTLHQAVFTLHPSYQGTQPPRGVLEEAARRNGGHMKDFPLRGALESGLGGASYVRTGVHTKLGHFVDHLVVMRKGGFPIAINQESRQDPTTRVYVEELEIPRDGQVVMVFCHPPSCYAVNCSRLKGYYVLSGKTLEALGYAVVHINLQQWTGIPDREKIPYLMQNVKLQCEAQTDQIYALQ
ncbi:uncharacterized protein LOC134535819 isoform X2 [Bacillus rossius redtenbacheri]